MSETPYHYECDKWAADRIKDLEAELVIEKKRSETFRECLRECESELATLRNEPTYRIRQQQAEEIEKLTAERDEAVLRLEDAKRVFADDQARYAEELKNVGTESDGWRERALKAERERDEALRLKGIAEGHLRATGDALALVEAENKRLREGLKKLEWSGFNFDEMEDNTCPACKGYQPFLMSNDTEEDRAEMGHKPDCWLKSLIGD